MTTSASLPIAVLQGYNTFTNSGASTALTGTTQTSSQGYSNTRVSVCQTIDQLHSALNISGSVSASFGVGSVDAKSQFVQQLDVSRTSISIVVYSQHVTTVSGKSDVNLQAPVDDILSFYNAYGDQYVTGLVAGGEYMAVFTFYTETVEEQESFNATLEGSGIYSGVQVDATLSANLESVTSSTSTRWTLQQQLTGVNDVSHPTQDQIIQFALDFPSLPLNAPVIISFETQGYESGIEGFPSQQFAPIVATRRQFLGTGGTTGFADLLADVSEGKNAMDAISAIYAAYNYTGDTTLASYQEQAAADIVTMTQFLQQVADDPTQSYVAPSLPSLSYGSPKLNYANYTSEMWGAGGTPFETVPFDAVDHAQAIHSITWGGTTNLSYLSITYDTDNGQVTQTFGQVPASSVTLTPAAGEFVFNISGTTGPLGLVALAMATYGSHSRSLVWPSEPPAYNFSFGATQENAAILGFNGAYTSSPSFPILSAVTQLQVVYALFGPAQWDQGVLQPRDEAKAMTA